MIKYSVKSFLTECFSVLCVFIYMRNDLSAHLQYLRCMMSHQGFTP